MAEVVIGDTWMKLDEEKEIPLIFLEIFNTSMKKFEQEGEFSPIWLSYKTRNVSLTKNVITTLLFWHLELS